MFPAQAENLLPSSPLPRGRRPDSVQNPSLLVKFWGFVSSFSKNTRSQRFPSPSAHVTRATGTEEGRFLSIFPASAEKLLPSSPVPICRRPRGGQIPSLLVNFSVFVKISLWKFHVVEKYKKGWTTTTHPIQREILFRFKIVWKNYLGSKLRAPRPRELNNNIY